MKAGNHKAFTLVELLVVIAIIGVLVALLLPAIQAARESARNAQCKNHLKQLSLAMLQHESALGHLPTGGWLGHWVGEPEYGANEEQPGGWIYNLLPFIEQQAIHDISLGMTAGLSKKRELATRDAIPISLLNCPTRRPSTPFPNAANKVPLNSYHSPMHGRSDYAQNAGDLQFLEWWCCACSPGSVPDAQRNWTPSLDVHSGIGFCGRGIELRQITDGTSNTYSIGERFLEPKHYESGLGHADDWPMYTGYQDDLYRSVWYDVENSNGVAYIPIRDRDDYEDINGADGIGGVHSRFGSAHPAGCNIAMVDGSVQSVLYDVDPEVHRISGDRSDEGGRRVQNRDETPECTIGSPRSCNPEP